LKQVSNKIQRPILGFSVGTQHHFRLNKLNKKPPKIKIDEHGKEILVSESDEDDAPLEVQMAQIVNF